MGIKYQPPSTGEFTGFLVAINSRIQPWIFQSCIIGPSFMDKLDLFPGNLRRSLRRNTSGRVGLSRYFGIGSGTVFSFFFVAHLGKKLSTFHLFFKINCKKIEINERKKKWQHQAKPRRWHGRTKMCGSIIWGISLTHGASMGRTVYWPTQKP